jgi:CMP-N-acetylneuraminic acid synthetase
VTVICSIAARGGSKGIPGKNLKLLGDRPLIAHAIGAALRAQRVDKVVVNTEDPEIAQAAEKFGASAPFLRNPALADDHTPLLMVTKDTLLQLAAMGESVDVIVQLAATCPFITPQTIDASVELLDVESQCVVTLKRIEHEHPYRAKVLDENTGIFCNFITDVDVEKYQSRQDLPTLFCTSGGVYTRTRDLMLSATGRDFCFGSAPKGIVLSDVEAINIDRPIDFDYAQFMLDRRTPAR